MTPPERTRLIKTIQYHAFDKIRMDKKRTFIDIAHQFNTTPTTARKRARRAEYILLRVIDQPDYTVFLTGVATMEPVKRYLTYLDLTLEEFSEYLLPLLPEKEPLSDTLSVLFNTGIEILGLDYQVYKTLLNFSHVLTVKDLLHSYQFEVLAINRLAHDSLKHILETLSTWCRAHDLQLSDYALAQKEATVSKEPLKQQFQYNSNASIERLNLTIRTELLLMDNNLTTIKQLLEKSESDLLAFDHFLNKDIMHIVTQLNAFFYKQFTLENGDLNNTLNKLNLSDHVHHLLDQKNIKTIYQLIQVSYTQLMALPESNADTCEHIVTQLKIWSNQTNTSIEHYPIIVSTLHETKQQ